MNGYYLFSWFQLSRTAVKETIKMLNKNAGWNTMTCCLLFVLVIFITQHTNLLKIKLTELYIDVPNHQWHIIPDFVQAGCKLRWTAWNVLREMAYSRTTRLTCTCMFILQWVEQQQRQQKQYEKFCQTYQTTINRIPSQTVTLSWMPWH